jgi:hypothetical protein
MAFIHTNFLTGNDSTGDGTTALPYKTVFKALSVAASNDFIKVAGGQWSSALAGDFTFTQDSNVIQTTVSQVGTVLVDDILSFEDGQFGFDRFHIKVYAVTSTTITTSLFWMGETVTTNTVKRLDAYHYSQLNATPNTFETWNTTDIQPNGRTGITISGGWSSDYTVQNGWTVIRRTGQGISVVNQAPRGFIFTAPGGIGNWERNLIWDRFMAHTTAIWGSTGQGSSFAMNELATVKGALNVNTDNTLGGYFGLWQADPAVPAKLYTSSSGTTAAMNNINGALSTNPNRPEVFEIDVWGTITANTTTTPNFNAMAGFGMYSAIGKEGSINQMNLYLRQQAFTLYSGFYQGYANSNNFAGVNAGVYIKKLIYYADKPQTIYWNLMNNQTAQIENIEVLGTAAAKSPFYIYGAGGQMIIDLFDEGKTVDSFNFGVGWTGSFGGEVTLNQICQSNLSAIQVKDIEGLKTLDTWNNIYFKNNGSLKINSGTYFSDTSAILHIWKMVGVIDKRATPFTVNFTLKVDTGAEADWDTIAVQYGPNGDQIITQALTPTDEYATYSITVNPIDYADWAKFKFPVYFGIRSKGSNVFELEPQSYVYIQSVTVS